MDSRLLTGAVEMLMLEVISHGATYGYEIAQQVESPPANSDPNTDHSVTHVLDESGDVNCGYVEPGIYEVRITTPWHEWALHEFTVHPGEEHVEQINAPAALPHFRSGHFSFRIAGIPQSDSPKGMLILMAFTNFRDRQLGDIQWSSLVGRPKDHSMLGILLYAAPDGKMWISEPWGIDRDFFKWRNVADEQKITDLKSASWGPVNDLSLLEGSCELKYCAFGLTDGSNPDATDWQNVHIDLDSFKDPKPKSTQIGFYTKFEASLNVVVDPNQTNTVELTFPQTLFEGLNPTDKNSK